MNVRRPLWRASLTLALAANSSSLAGQSRADPVATPRLRADDRAFVELSASGSLAPSTSEVGSAHVSPQLSAGVRVLPRLALGVDVAASFTGFRATGDSHRSASRVGNPLVSALYTVHSSESRALTVGFALAPPLVLTRSGLPEAPTARFGDRVAHQARGMEVGWLWADNAVPVVVPISGRTMLGRTVELGADVQPGALVSVNRNSSRLAVLVAGQAGAVVGPIRVGLRAVLYAESIPLEGHDFVQTSLSPFVRLDFDRAWFRMAYSQNLDAPFGPTEANVTWWGVNVGTGVRF